MGSPDVTRVVALDVERGNLRVLCVSLRKNGGNGAKETLSMASPLRDDPEMLNEI